MKHKVLKILACISLVAMVLCAVTPGAFADETGTSDEARENGDHKMGHGPRGEPGIDGQDIEAPVFDTEEEEMEFLVERETEHITERIEMLEEKLADSEDEDEQAEIEEQIDELEELLDAIENAETLDELKEVLEEYRENNPRPHGHGVEYEPMDRASELVKEVTNEE